MLQFHSLITDSVQRHFLWSSQSQHRGEDRLPQDLLFLLQESRMCYQSSISKWRDSGQKRTYTVPWTSFTQSTQNTANISLCWWPSTSQKQLLQGCLWRRAEKNLFYINTPALLQTYQDVKLTSEASLSLKYPVNSEYFQDCLEGTLIASFELHQADTSLSFPSLLLQI